MLGQQAGTLRHDTRSIHAYAMAIERAREGMLQRLTAVSSGAEARPREPCRTQP